jgi:hypothetical protein
MRKTSRKYINLWHNFFSLLKQGNIINNIIFNINKGFAFQIITIGISLVQLELRYESQFLILCIGVINFGVIFKKHIGFTGDTMSDKEFQQRKDEWNEMQEKKEKYKKQVEGKYGSN